MPCADDILAALAQHPDGLSLPRLCKRLGLRMSVLLRELAWLGADTIGDVPGPDLVRVEQHGELTMAVLTDVGRRRLDTLQTDAPGQPLIR